MHASWKAYFENVDSGSDTAFVAPPNMGQKASADGAGQLDQSALNQILAALQSGGAPTSGTKVSQSESGKIMNLIRAYMNHGHQISDIDPLDLNDYYVHHESYRSQPITLNYSYYGFTEQDLDREFFVDAPELGGILKKKKNWVLRDLIDQLNNAYCGKRAIEYNHIHNKEELNWIRDNFETMQYHQFSTQEKKEIYGELMEAHGFASFLTNKFNTQKRFGVEGCETFIPAMTYMVDELADGGVEKVIIGMPHRGRLNVLANVVKKPLEKIFAEFQGVVPTGEEASYFGSSGDVKYHLGTSYVRNARSGKQVKLSLLPNPSHLETVDPVVMGRVRAEQHYMNNNERNLVCGIVIHGDAAFAGQGVVYESMQMQQLFNYTTGGTIHIIVNNQVGFTTAPRDARSGFYCTDLAKAIDAPIIHVNGDSMEDVARVVKFAAQYRQKFKKDVVLDIIGYRRFGHNELDQPMFTQPLMYTSIAKRPVVARIYEDQLLSEGVITKDEAKILNDKIQGEIEESYANSKTFKFKPEDWSQDVWEEIKNPTKYGRVRDTGVDINILRDIGTKINTLPVETFKFHPMVKKIYGARLKSI